jgi:hypothetical protein
LNRKTSEEWEIIRGKEGKKYDKIRKKGKN